jgi:hypothetical protein
VVPKPLAVIGAEKDGEAVQVVPELADVVGGVADGSGSLPHQGRRGRWPAIAGIAAAQ